MHIFLLLFLVLSVTTESQAQPIWHYIMCGKHSSKKRIYPSEAAEKNGSIVQATPSLEHKDAESQVEYELQVDLKFLNAGREPHYFEMDCIKQAKTKLQTRAGTEEDCTLTLLRPTQPKKREAHHNDNVAASFLRVGGGSRAVDAAVEEARGGVAYSVPKPTERSKNDDRFEMPDPVDLSNLEVEYATEIPKDIRSVIRYLNNRKRYLRRNITNFSSILMHGVPGVGKTALARVVAKHGGCDFYQLSAEKFVDSYVGQSARHFRDMVETIRERVSVGDKCAVVFIDEIDSLATSREHQTAAGERKGALTEMLVQLDGFSKKALEKVIFMFATNKLLVLDDAFKSRCGRQIEILLPTFDDRVKIIACYLNKCFEAERLAQDKKLVEELAKRSDKCSPREIEDCIRRAACTVEDDLLDKEASKNTQASESDDVEVLDALGEKVLVALCKKYVRNSFDLIKQPEAQLSYFL